jgi:hypothetical protein
MTRPAQGASPPQVGFTLTLVPLPGVDGIRSLRRALKTLLRRDGLKCVDIRGAEPIKSPGKESLVGHPSPSITGD